MRFTSIHYPCHETWWDDNQKRRTYLATGQFHHQMWDHYYCCLMPELLHLGKCHYHKPSKRLANISQLWQSYLPTPASFRLTSEILRKLKKFSSKRTFFEDLGIYFGGKMWWPIKKTPMEDESPATHALCCLGMSCFCWIIETIYYIYMYSICICLVLRCFFMCPFSLRIPWFSVQFALL